MISLLKRHPTISRVNKYIFPSASPPVKQTEHRRSLSLVCRPAAQSDWPSICEVCVPAFEGLDYIPSQFPTFLSVQKNIRRCFVFIDRSNNKLVCLYRLFLFLFKLTEKPMRHTSDRAQFQMLANIQEFSVIKNCSLFYKKRYQGINFN